MIIFFQEEARKHITPSAEKAFELGFARNTASIGGTESDVRRCAAPASFRQPREILVLAYPVVDVEPESGVDVDRLPMGCAFWHQNAIPDEFLHGVSDFAQFMTGEALHQVVNEDVAGADAAVSVEFETDGGLSRIEPSHDGTRAYI